MNGAIETPPLTRRGFLGAATAATVALAAGQVRCGGEGRSAIVVGAGLAGLLAADRLATEGFDVTVIEARERLGGRVLTVRRPFAAGQIAEGGGEYIDSVHTVMLGLADRFGLALDDLRAVGAEGAGIVIRDGLRERYGQLASDPAAAADYDRYYEATYRLSQRIRAAGGEALAEELDANPVSALLDRTARSALGRFLLEDRIRADYTAEPGRLSLLFVVAAERAYNEVPERNIEAFRIRGGNDRLVAALADDLDGEIVTGAAADAVSQDGSGVTVEAAGRSFRGELCVLAAPLPALRRIEIAPGLPTPVARTVRTMAYGAVTKTLMQFASRTWSRAGLSGYGATDLPVGTTWDATDAQPGPRGILTSYAAGDAALAAALSPAAAAGERAVDGAEALFPGSAAQPGAIARVPWPTEPFSGGSYVAPAPGEALGLPSLRRRFGRIALAGEHTDRRFPGYMEGAARSGLRAAQQLLES